MIIAIDGPTASGKSTVAHMLAQKLGMYYVSTGLLYRALSYALLHKYKYEEKQLVTPAIDDVRSCLDPRVLVYDYKGQQGAAVYFDGKDITPFLKTKQIDHAASLVASNQGVRAELLKFQRAFAQTKDIVMEGRDIGSVIFPNADFKFFVTASPEIRAQRWREYQAQKGIQFSFEESLKTITARDTRDKERHASPLVIPEGAVLIDTSSLTKEEALQKILTHVRRF